MSVSVDVPHSNSSFLLSAYLSACVSVFIFFSVVQMEFRKVKKVKPLTFDNPTCEKRLTRGCSNLMYACQQGLTDSIVKELRNKVKLLYKCAVRKSLFFVFTIFFFFTFLRGRMLLIQI